MHAERGICAHGNVGHARTYTRNVYGRLACDDYATARICPTYLVRVAAERGEPAPPPLERRHGGTRGGGAPAKRKRIYIHTCIQRPQRRRRHKRRRRQHTTDDLTRSSRPRANKRVRPLNAGRITRRDCARTVTTTKQAAGGGEQPTHHSTHKRARDNNPGQRHRRQDARRRQRPIRLGSHPAHRANGRAKATAKEKWAPAKKKKAQKSRNDVITCMY